jgi:hypothetical protein
VLIAEVQARLNSHAIQLGSEAAQLAASQQILNEHLNRLNAGAVALISGFSLQNVDIPLQEKQTPLT